MDTALRMQAVATVIHAVVEKANKIANTALMPMLYPNTRLRPSESMTRVDTMLPGRLAAATMNESWYGLRLKLTCARHRRTHRRDHAGQDSHGHQGCFCSNSGTAANAGGSECGNKPA